MMSQVQKEIEEILIEYQNVKDEKTEWIESGKSLGDSEEGREIRQRFRLAELKLEDASSKIKSGLDGTLLMKATRIFLSYSSKDKHIIGDLKRQLEEYGFIVFVAHHDISPSIEWQKEIIKNLEICDVFIPYLTHDFKLSNWTDQETGIAYSLDKFIIPLKVDIDPYGFISKFQGLKTSSKSITTVTGEIYRTINNSDKVRGIIDYNIDYFLSSESYDEANSRVKMLERIEQFTGEQVNRICVYSIANDQIYKAFAAQDFLREFLERYKEIINDLHYQLLKGLIR